MKIGDKFKRNLPKWICNGEIVIITVIGIFKNKLNYNFHDFKGEYKDSKGNLHQGKFYLKDCEEV